MVSERPTANRDAEVAALGRALAVERRARYIDFRGKRSTFSEFVRHTANRMCKRYPLDSCWTTIRGLFTQYPNLDVASRISIVRRTEELLFPPVHSASEAAGGDPLADPVADAANPLVQAGSLRSSGTAHGAASHSPKAGKTTPPKLDNTTPVPERKKQPNAFKDEVSLPATEVKPKPRMDKDPTTVDVKYVKGVGPKMAAVFERMGIYTAADLIRHYPRHHLDFQNRLLIRELQPGQEVTVFGTIRSVGAFQSRKGNVSILSIVIGDGTGSVLISRFIGGRSNKYLLDRYQSQYPKGAQVIASGLVERDRYSGRLQLKNSELEILAGTAADEEEMGSLHTNRLVPVYPLTEGLGLRYLRSVIHNALEMFDHALEDPIPESLRLRNNLLPLKQALWGIHFPEDVESKDEARRRLVFDELFAVQLQLAHRRWERANSEDALAFKVPDGGLIESFKQALPFTLTGAQQRVFAEVARDLASNKPMHRLVQGDVGSGKTVVAAMASLIAIENGYQVAVMAPTEILAEQHFRQFQRWLTPLGLRVALFVGKQGVKERRAVQQALLAGQVHVAIGTHALIQDDVEFNKLGLIVIDEQHRFGVKQRAKLKAKGYNPELLTMTATPIPRTLALTVHGDLDVSEIDELPPGRKAIKTKLVGSAQKGPLWSFIKQELLKGRQAYIVFPLIEESESLSAKAATAEFETLRTTEFPEPQYRIGLMHGKLKPQEKEVVMEQFRKGELQILVCTTVIEVGVDVPNATVMVIENADRFGLAQLHQLRGRVGRGGEQSYCFLVANAGSETTRQRLEIMEKTNDGFVVAQKDLELRGPGEFLGTRQSGMPDLVLADLVNDATILEQARKSAIDLIKEDPRLEAHKGLRKFIERADGSELSEIVQSG
ncbi:MAG TPA: ATP-dependent DNA helicase RecG [Candidatus Obscuribacterales bacterium]